MEYVMIYGQISCSSWVRFPQSVLWFLWTLSLACNWDDFEGSWVCMLPADVNPCALIWAPRIWDHLAKSESLRSDLNWGLTARCSPLDVWKALSANPKERVLQVRRPLCWGTLWLSRCQFKIWVFSVGAPEYIHLTLPNEKLPGWVLTRFL